MHVQTVKENGKLMTSQRRLARAAVRTTTDKLTKLKKSRKDLVKTLSIPSSPRNPCPDPILTINKLPPPIESTATPEETMKVKELRNWLADLSEKHKEHYHRDQHLRLEDHKCNDEHLVIHRKPSTTATSPTSSRDSASPREDSNMDPAFFCAGSSPLSSDSKEPATVIEDQAESQDGNVKVLSSENLATITPSSSCDEACEGEIKNNQSGDTSTTQADTDLDDHFPQVLTESWDSDGSWWIEQQQISEGKLAHCESYDELDSSYFEAGRLSVPGNLSGETKDFSRRKTFGGIQGIDNMGHDHLTLLCKQAPVLTYLNEDVSNEVPSIAGEGLPATMNMHNANLFDNKILTKSTLDFICDDGRTEKSKTNSINTVDSCDDETNSACWSNDSSKPSIAPAAMESKVGRMLLNNNDDANAPSAEERAWSTKTEPQAKDETLKEQNLAPQRVTRKKIDPMDLPFLQPKAKPSGEKHEVEDGPRSRKKIDPKDLPFLQPKTKPSEKKQQVEQAPRSSVSTGIYKFGGPRRKIVERRTEELQKLWAENKAATHVKKIKWGVCQRTGTYRKKVVVDVQYK